MVYVVEKVMIKHVFKETEVVTSLGDMVSVPLCENCGAPEFDKGPCDEGYLTLKTDYLEKALKAVASV
jgi:hypothetical protein